MKATILFISIFFILAGNIKAARPSQQPTGFAVKSTSCRSVKLSWKNGNGRGRIIIGREGSPVTYTPVDGTIYKSSNAFGMSASYNSDNFIVYNDTVPDSAIIANLKMGKTYYFTIYEHDNGGTNILYNTTSPPSVNSTTLSVSIRLSVTANDSCFSSNKYTFSYTSTSNVPGISSFLWDFGDGSTSANNPATHSFTNAGYFLTTIKATTGINNCNISAHKIINVYRDKNVSVVFPDSVQCFTTNIFKGYVGLIPNTLYTNYRLYWDFGDSTYSIDTNIIKSYKKSGLYNVKLSVRTFSANGDSLGCNETKKIRLRVLENRLLKINIPLRQHVITNNLFVFENNDSSLTSPLWDFNDGITEEKWRTKHTFSDTGLYIVKHSVYDADNKCYDKDTFQIKVNPDPSSGLKSLQYPPVKIYPNPASGILTVNTAEMLVKNICITDINGKNIKIIIPDKQQTIFEINLSEISSGIYILKIQTERGNPLSHLLNIQH